jgi:hypothetical protein
MAARDDEPSSFRTLNIAHGGQDSVITDGQISVDIPKRNDGNEVL